MGAGGEAVLVSASLADAEMVVDEALAELARDGLAHPDEAGEHRWRIGPWGWSEPSYDVKHRRLSPGEVKQLLARYPKRSSLDPVAMHEADRRSVLGAHVERCFFELLPISEDTIAGAWPCRCDRCTADAVALVAASEISKRLPWREQRARDEAELAACMLRDLGGPPARLA